MIQNINSQFQAVRGAPIESIAAGQLGAMLETTDHSVIISHKWVGPMYSTTCFDETDGRIYRSHHPFGILKFWKLMTLTNPRLRLLKPGEKYVPKETK
jgi:hypothetical protein